MTAPFRPAAASDFPRLPFCSFELWRAYVAILVPIIGALGAVTALLYWRDVSAAREIHREKGRHIVDLHSEIISREIDLVRSDLHYLREEASLFDFLQSADEENLRRMSAAYLLFSRRRALYDQIRYLDEQGREIVRVNYRNGHPTIVSPEDLQSKAERYYFRETSNMRPGEVFVSPMDLNIEHGEIESPPKPVVRFATGVKDRSGTRRGVLVLNYLGSHLLRKLDETDSRSHGPVLLLDGKGTIIRGHQPDGKSCLLLGSGRSFPKENPGSWEQIARAPNSQFFGPAGLITYSRLPLSDGAESPALLVVRNVSKDELRRAPRELLRKLLLLVGLIVLLAAIPSWFLARARSARRSALRQLALSEERLRTLSTELLSAQEDERRKISRDLHDDLGQVITASTLNLERARIESDPKECHQLIEKALLGVRTVLGRVHEMSSQLRPPLLDDLGLMDAIVSYLSDYERLHPIRVRSRLEIDSEGEIPTTVRENVYRILQEALNNVAKYAQVEEVRVDISADRDTIGLLVQDEGVGFRPTEVEPSSLGLLGMRERAELLKGNFQIDSEPGRGTTIQVSLPLNSRQRAPGVRSSSGHSSS